MTAHAEAAAARTLTTPLDEPVAGRSPSRLAWERLRRDRAALVGGAVVVALALVAVFAPVLANHDPNQLNTHLLDGPKGGIPAGAWGGVSTDHWLGIEPTNGRDLYSRVLYGARISLLIAVVATALAVLLGAVVGLTAGYFGGKVDALLSRVMDVLLGFPVVVFAIALISVAGHVDRVVMLVSVIGFFGWPFIGRIVRAQVMSLRERDYVDAARSLGAGSGHILFRELLPNLSSSLIVLGTLLLPVNVLTEAALSFLGIGVPPPTASWGQMLSSAATWAPADPLYLAVPGTALFVTVFAFNLLGDGLRDALDPRSAR